MRQSIAGADPAAFGGVSDCCSLRVPWVNAKAASFDRDFLAGFWQIRFEAESGVVRVSMEALINNETVIR